MIIIMNAHAAESEIDRIRSTIEDLGCSVHVFQGLGRHVLGLTGNTEKIDTGQLELNGNVDRVIRITPPYKLASRSHHPTDSVINVGGVKVGGGDKVFIAGPCSVESIDQITEIAQAVKNHAHILRGGAYKPRTSPYSFQGLAEKGLQMLKEAGEISGMPTVTEVVSPEDVDLVANYVDMLQIGARNMQNFALLRKVGQTRKPVLLKRGMAATIEDLLMSAEYIMDAGNPNIILCERGIRTFEPMTRNTLDISAIPIVHKLSHLPIIVDPSHAAGKWGLVEPLAKAAWAAGADGLMIEVHHHPECALSDGAQSLLPKRYCHLVDEVREHDNQ